MSAPDPRAIPRDEITVKRNRKGRTSSRVTRAARGQTIGDCVLTPTLLAHLAGIDVLADERGDITMASDDECAVAVKRWEAIETGIERARRGNIGTVSDELVRLADAIMQDDSLALLGSDSGPRRSWAQVVPAQRVETTDILLDGQPAERRIEAPRSIALWRSGLTGRHSVTDADDLAQHTAVCAVQTSTRWPVRGENGQTPHAPRERASETHYTDERSRPHRVALIRRDDGTLKHGWIAPADQLRAWHPDPDMMWVGHALKPRGPRVEEVREIQRQTAADDALKRQIANAVHVDAVTPELLAALPIGETLDVTNGHQVITTRAVARDGWHKRYRGRGIDARTADTAHAQLTRALA